jgi:hypothetical protein
MLTSAQFKKGVEHGGVTGKFKSPGRITFITAALEAFEQAEQQHLPDIQQLSYLYEVLKQCKKWLALKANKTSAKSLNRKTYVKTLMDDIPVEMAIRFPDLFRALSTFEHRKANPVGGQATGPQGVYAHESSLYSLNKSQGRFSNPAAPRLTGSATLLQPELYKLDNPKHASYKAFTKSSIKEPSRKGLFKELTEQQFRELDKLCLGQFNVLYLSKIQRLQFMLIVEDGLLKRHDGSLITLMPGATVHTELEKCPYAADKYGNIFVTSETDHPGVKINHTTLCAGHEVLCAGTISIKNGELRAISNNSGHYQPSTAQLLQVLTLLMEAGVPMENVLVVDNAQGQLECTANPFMAGNYKPLLSMRATQLKNRTS